jgi:hypothetical protein
MVGNGYTEEAREGFSDDEDGQNKTRYIDLLYDRDKHLKNTTVNKGWDRDTRGVIRDI